MKKFKNSSSLPFNCCETCSIPLKKALLTIVEQDSKLLLLLKSKKKIYKSYLE